MVSESILDYMPQLGLHVTDIYLMGSTLIETSSGKLKDIDSVILIQDLLSLELLRKTRVKLDIFIRQNFDPSVYHYKLFNQKELELMAQYDGFRLFEFQHRYLSLIGTTNMHRSTPLLNQTNLCNSILIQVVHDFLTNPNRLLSGTKVFSRKVQLRIKRNIEIAKITRNDYIIAESNIAPLCLNRNGLFSRFCNLIRHQPLHHEQLNLFMQTYFTLFRHEYINKYDTYWSAIKETTPCLK